MTPESLMLRRRRLGLTQAALARVLGVDRTTIVRWERGHGPIPDPLALETALSDLEAQRTPQKLARGVYS